MSRGESRKTKRVQAARERAREAHVKLVVERGGDPRFVQQTRTATGRTVHLRPQDVAAFREQQELFVKKFGREPGPEDPIFFDPTKDVPTELDPATAFPEIRAAAISAGVDPAYIDAWEDVGYLITEENRHLFSAHEVEAYGEALQRARDLDGRPDVNGHAEDSSEDDVIVIDMSEERIAARREDAVRRLNLTNLDAITAAREARGHRIGRIITMTTATSGECIADVEVIREGVHQPFASNSLDEHVEDVVFSLREQSFAWLEGSRRDHVDTQRMPALADFVAMSSGEQLTTWVRDQMSRH